MNQKILSAQDARAVSRRYHTVATNGCFDILHAGHIAYLQKAYELGGRLVVGINSDESVRALKGPSRPINNQNDRAEVVAALECVDYVVIFDSKTAVDFLAAVKPNVWLKGGDYTIDTLDVAERETVLKNGGKIEIIQSLPGRSTTGIVSHLDRELVQALRQARELREAIKPTIELLEQIQSFIANRKNVDALASDVWSGLQRLKGVGQ